MKKLKVAIVHDYLREYGGAERVVEDLHQIFPDAEVFTAFYKPKGLGSAEARFKSWKIHTSWLQNLPFADKLVSPMRLFATSMFESFDLSSFDLVISSDAIYFAKSVITTPHTLHLSYIHTPPRYLYGYTTSYNYKKHWWTRVGGELINFLLRPVDFVVSQRPDILVTNSENVRERIKKYYRRDAEVIFPGTDVDKIEQGSKGVEKGDYFLFLGRLVRSKGAEIAIAAANQTGLKLKVAGTGPMFDELKSLSGKSVEMLGQVSDVDRIKLLAGAKAFLLLEEQPDFGITSIEAQAAGTPVIAVRAGGYIETVEEGKTGVFIENATVDELAEVMKGFDKNHFRKEDLQKNARRFSKQLFRDKLLEVVKSKLHNM